MISLDVRILLAVLILSVGCQRRTTEEVVVVSSPPPPPASYPSQLDVSLDTAPPDAFRHMISDEQPLPTTGLNPNTVSLTTAPSWLALVPNTNRIRGEAPDQDGPVQIQFSGQNANAQSETRSWSPQILSDPLFKYAWHLLNTGQTNFARNPGLGGADLRLTSAWRDRWTGNGVKIAISDVAAQLDHEDLAANVIPGNSRNYALPSPYLGVPPASDGHATAVAGLIAARGWNGKGSRGVAPQAKFVNFNYVESAQTLSMALNQLDGPFDIFNQSFGVTTNRELALDSSYRDKLRWGVENLRQGRGALYVKAAGNGFNNCVSAWCSQNASADPYNANPFVIVVGALSARDSRASYSSPGSSLWISAYGGEYGTSNPAMMTTDLTGCDRGYSPGNNTNSFENDPQLNPGCNYTSTFNGTSAATPLVSGAVALMLQANPLLRYRDVKRILATTARQVDAGSLPLNVPQSGVPIDLGWQTNSANYKFHNWYGFGAVDASAAVASALTYTNFLPNPQETRTASAWSPSSGSLQLPIPDGSRPGVKHKLYVSQNWSVETIEVKINVEHRYPSEIAVVLRSPSGTQSLMLNPLNTFTEKANLDNLVLVSNAFYGELSMGEWEIEVMDAINLDTGLLKDWAINIVGNPI